MEKDLSLHKILIKVNKAHRRWSHEEFKKINISEGQPKILNYLAKNDGCIQRELASNCHIEPATVTSILNSMERTQLIYRRQNPNDKRVLHVFLTEKGKAVQKEVDKIFSSIDEECFNGFSDEEKKETIRLLKRIYENIKRKEI